MNKFYVYAWYNIDTNEVFYIGKGCGKRYLNTSDRNQKFQEYIQTNQVDVKILENDLSEQEAWEKEKYYTQLYKNMG